MNLPDGAAQAQDESRRGSTSVDGRSTSQCAPGREAGSTRPATQEELRGWIESTTGGSVSHWRQISGGNRCWSFAVDVEGARAGVNAALYLRYQPPRPPSTEPYTVWREAKFYEALRTSAVPAPKLVAVHPGHQAILTERVSGQAEFRRIKSPAERGDIARDFIEALARLHALPLAELELPGFAPGASMADCVRQELAIWQAMYDESGRRDPLIDLAMDWLKANVPAAAEAPVFVHGDAGQGNFLFENGRMTALLDWELAHAGDPMEDLAWFSMRSVMEPVENFAGLLKHYAATSGRPLDHQRIRYHRVLVSTRVVIIRHRNVTGKSGNSIVSRGLNRRLLVTALAEANGIALQRQPALDLPATAQTPLFDDVIRDLWHDIAEAGAERPVVEAAKNAAKVIKYLRDVDRFGAGVERGELAALAETLGYAPATVEDGKIAALDRVRAGRLPLDAAICCFARCVGLESQLSASASGGLARRTFPPLDDA